MGLPPQETAIAAHTALGSTAEIAVRAAQTAPITTMAAISSPNGQSVMLAL